MATLVLRDVRVEIIEGRREDDRDDTVALVRVVSDESVMIIRGPCSVSYETREERRAF